MTSLARSTIITSPQSHFCRAPTITFLSSTCAQFQIAKRPQSHLSQTPQKRAHNHRLQNAHNHILTETPHKCVCCGRLCFQQSIPKYNIFQQSIPKYNMARTLFTARTTPRIFYVKTTKDISQSNCKLAGWRNTVLLWIEWLEMNVCTQIKLVINAVSHNIFGLRRDLLFYTKIPELLS